MIRDNLLTKVFLIIRGNKFLRTINVLNLIMILGVIALLYTNFSYGAKIQANISGIEASKQLAQSLDTTAQPSQATDTEESILTKKSFAKYENVIPFVAILENMFSVIDPESEVNIKGKEDEMYLNHYADYSVNLKVQKDKKPLFLQAFNELYNSKFITEVTSFSINYLPEIDESIENPDSADFTIRLYLN